MGGLGSGSWYRSNTKALTNNYSSLDVHYLNRENLLYPGCAGSLMWQRDGEQQASISFQVDPGQLILSYKFRYPSEDWENVRETVTLTSTPCHYGGDRPWFRCPGVVNNVLCDRRVSKLYARSHYFLCRHCSKLTYPSQNVTPEHRAITRSQSIRRQLGGSANLLVPFPWKPKNMHWTRYWRLRDRETKAELERLTIMQRWWDRHTNILAQMKRSGDG